MSDSIRIWSVDGDALSELPRQPVDLESRLEDWMDADVSVLSDDLLVIGRQLDTEGGGILDLLCLDRAGDVVVVELKRGKTPREVVAQTLDYAAWASDLSFEELKRIGDPYLAESGGLDAAFRARFDADLPDVLNAEHRLLIVASEIDPRSERIIRYLAETRGVPINAVTFNYFQTANGGEFLARTQLVESEVAEEQTVRRSGSKRRRNLTPERLRAAAEDLGLGDTYDQLVRTLNNRFQFGRTMSAASFRSTLDGSRKAIFNVVTAESIPERGLKFVAYTNRLATVLGTSREEVYRALPELEPYSWQGPETPEDAEEKGYEGYMQPSDVDRFVAWLDGQSGENASGVG